jgi:opacity protein-like surface antigen
VVGVGLEYGFSPNWSAGIEYNHLFMQDRTHTFVDPVVAASSAPIASARTSISSPSASTTAGVAP